MANDNKIIKANLDKTPTIFDGEIKAGDMLQNSFSGMGTIIIDKDFLDEMDSIVHELNTKKGTDIVSLLYEIHNKIQKYFFSLEKNELTREQTYSYYTIEEDGFPIGTNLSSLKGKNISECSEKSIGAYIVLRKLYEIGLISSKPILVLSHVTDGELKPEKHAFTIIDKEQCEYPLKHILFDIQNQAYIEDKNGKQYLVSRICSLKEEEYNNLLNGLECTPNLIFETSLYGNQYHIVGKPFTYGKPNTKGIQQE